MCGMQRDLIGWGSIKGACRQDTLSVVIDRMKQWQKLKMIRNLMCFTLNIDTFQKFVR